VNLPSFFFGQSLWFGYHNVTREQFFQTYVGGEDNGKEESDKESY
jgi:hypothetical protein